MKMTTPIKDDKKLNELLDVYDEYSKNQLLLKYCLNTGLRISDVLSQKVGPNTTSQYIEMKEQKTRKTKTISLSNQLKRYIDTYVKINELSSDDYLFFNSRDKSKNISRQMAHKIISNAGEMVGLDISAHSLRKTFGYRAYKQGVDLSLLMDIFNHSNQSVTLKYIGITQDNINTVYESMNIGF